MKPKELFELATEISEKTSEYYELIPSIANVDEYIPAFNSGTVSLELLKI